MLPMDSAAESVIVDGSRCRTDELGTSKLSGRG